LVQRRNLIVDVSDTKLVDHSVMEKLGEIQRDFEQEGLSFEVRGLDSLRPLADNPHAARKSGVNARQLVATFPSAMEADFLARLSPLVSTTRFVRLPCDVGSLVSGSSGSDHDPFTRIEVIVSASEYEAVLRELKMESNEDNPVSIFSQPAEMRSSFPSRAKVELPAGQ